MFFPRVIFQRQRVFLFSSYYTGMQYMPFSKCLLSEDLTFICTGCWTFRTGGRLLPPVCQGAWTFCSVFSVQILSSQWKLLQSPLLTPRQKSAWKSEPINCFSNLKIRLPSASSEHVWKKSWDCVNVDIVRNEALSLFCILAANKQYIFINPDEVVDLIWHFLQRASGQVLAGKWMDGCKYTAYLLQGWRPCSMQHFLYKGHISCSACII